MRIYLLLGILLATNIIFAQNKKLSGLILESKTSLPIEGATVTLLPSNQVTLTDERGRFFFKKILPMTRLKLLLLDMEQLPSQWMSLVRQITS